MTKILQILGKFGQFPLSRLPNSTERNYRLYLPEFLSIKDFLRGAEVMGGDGGEDWEGLDLVPHRK